MVTRIEMLIMSWDLLSYHAMNRRCIFVDKKIVEKRGIAPQERRKSIALAMKLRHSSCINTPMYLHRVAYHKSINLIMSYSLYYPSWKKFLVCKYTKIIRKWIRIQITENKYVNKAHANLDTTWVDVTPYFCGKPQRIGIRGKNRRRRCGSSSSFWIGKRIVAHRRDRQSSRRRQRMFRNDQNCRGAPTNRNGLTPFAVNHCEFVVIRFCSFQIVERLYALS